jgi:4-hydroxy-3-polyprenylbenzoate decarboxylase
MSYVVGITGASGAPYAQTLLRYFYQKKISTHLLLTKASLQVIKEEIDLEFGPSPQGWRKGLEKMIGREYFKHICLHDLEDWHSPLASGSYKTDAMIIIPCSVHTLSAIATGQSSNLLERRADIMLKEKKTLVIVFREMPLNSIHLEHLLKLSQMGAHVLPAAPGFYHHPKTIQEMVDFVIGRVLDVLEIPNALYKRWGE